MCDQFENAKYKGGDPEKTLIELEQITAQLEVKYSPATDGR